MLLSAFTATYSHLFIILWGVAYCFNHSVFYVQGKNKKEKKKIKINNNNKDKYFIIYNISF